MVEEKRLKPKSGKRQDLRLIVLKKSVSKEVFKLQQNQVIYELRNKSSRIQEKHRYEMLQLEKKMMERFSNRIKNVTAVYGTSNQPDKTEIVQPKILLSPPTITRQPRMLSKRKLDFDDETPDNVCKIPRMNSFCIRRM